MSTHRLPHEPTAHGDAHRHEQSPVVPFAEPLLELSAWLGFARACAHSARVQSILHTLQADLRRIGRQFTDPDAEGFPPERIAWLEEVQEALGQERPGWDPTELPGDTVSGAVLDLATVIARRLGAQLREREGWIDPSARNYLERIPDVLFLLARYEESQANPLP